MKKQHHPELAPLPTEDRHNQSIILQRDNGDHIELTASQIEKWFARVQHSIDGHRKMTPQLMDAITPSLATKFLSHYGLQRPLDVVRFLNSPQGEAVVSMIRERLANEAALFDSIQQDLREQERSKERQLAYLLLGLIMEDEAHAAELNEAAQQTIEKVIKDHVKATTSNSDSPRPTYELEQRVDAYTQSIKSIETQLDVKRNELEVLELEDAELQKQYEQLTEEQTHLNTHIDAIEDSLLSPTEPTENLHDRISLLSDQVDTDALKITQSVETGDVAATQDQMRRNQARNMMINLLREAFPEQKKIVQIDGRSLLLPASLDVSNITHEDKESGEKAYVALKPQLHSIKQRVQENYQLAQQAHLERIERRIDQRVQLLMEVSLLANQMTKLQAARANVQAFLRSPQPAFGGQAAAAALTSTPAVNTTGMAQSYKQILQSPLTQQSTDRLTACALRMGAPRPLIDSISKLKAGERIPAPLMAAILRQPGLGTAWLNPTNPAEVLKANLAASRKVAKHDAAPSLDPDTAPSPLATTPKPQNLTKSNWG